MTEPATTRRPRVPRLAALAVLTAAVTVAGGLLGALWAVIAPPIHGVIALTRHGERVQAYLGGEGEHFFVAPALLLGLLAVLAVVATAAGWQWTAHRGPGMVAGLSVGLLAGTALALLIGAVLVHRRYGEVTIDAAPVGPEQRTYYFVEAPPVLFGHQPLQVAATLLLPAATAALAYALCATWSPRDDLGGFPPAITAGVGAPTYR